MPPLTQYLGMLGVGAPQIGTSPSTEVSLVALGLMNPPPAQVLLKVDVEWPQAAVVLNISKESQRDQFIFFHSSSDEKTIIAKWQNMTFVQRREKEGKLTKPFFPNLKARKLIYIVKHLLRRECPSLHWQTVGTHWTSCSGTRATHTLSRWIWKLCCWCFRWGVI